MQTMLSSLSRMNLSVNLRSYHLLIYKAGSNVCVTISETGECGSTVLASMAIDPEGRTITELFSALDVSLVLTE